MSVSIKVFSEHSYAHSSTYAVSGCFLPGQNGVTVTGSSQHIHVWPLAEKPAAPPRSQVTTRAGFRRGHKCSSLLPGVPVSPPRQSFPHRADPLSRDASRSRLLPLPYLPWRLQTGHEPTVQGPGSSLIPKTAPQPSRLLPRLRSSRRHDPRAVCLASALERLPRAPAAGPGLAPLRPFGGLSGYTGPVPPWRLRPARRAPPALQQGALGWAWRSDPDRRGPGSRSNAWTA